MKRTKWGKRRQVRDTAKQHRLNTEDGTMITTLVIPAQIPEQNELVGKAMLVDLRSVSVDRRFMLQLTADLRSVYSKSFKRVHYQ